MVKEETMKEIKTKFVPQFYMARWHVNHLQFRKGGSWVDNFEECDFWTSRHQACNAFQWEDLNIFCIECVRYPEGLGPPRA